MLLEMRTFGVKVGWDDWRQERYLQIGWRRNPKAADDNGHRRFLHCIDIPLSLGHYFLWWEITLNGDGRRLAFSFPCGIRFRSRDLQWYPLNRLWRRK